jgi:hypothetical protein
MELDEALVMEIGLAAALVDGEIEVESETATPPGAEYAVPRVIRAGEFVPEDSEAEPTSLPEPELVTDDDDSADDDTLTEDAVVDADQAPQDEDSVPANTDQASQDTD